MKLKQFIFALVAMLSSFAFTANAQVAKVGNTEYATINEAISKWTNGTTLTLLADVTLSDVIKLNSNEHHILDLGIYTMTAAKNKDAIEYVVKGRKSAGNALDIKADATNPGGITATGMAIIRHTKPLMNAPEKDRPITRFYGGKFNAGYIVWQGGLSTGYTGAKAPYFYFYGGEFNGTINTNRSSVQFHGGVFNGKLQMSVDSSSWGMVAGGKFKYLSNLQGSDLDEKIAQGVDHYKFTIGSAKATYDRGIYVDKDGYYVITSAPIKEVSAKYPAVYKKTYGGDDYFYYSAAQEYGLFYEDVDMAIKKHGAANVTVWEKPAVTIPENVTGDAAVVEEIKNNTALDNYTPANLPSGAELEIVLESVGETIVYDVTPMKNGAEVEPTQPITFRLPVPASVTETYAKVYHEDTLMDVYAIQGEDNAKYVEISSKDFSKFTVEPIVPTEVEVATLAELQAALADNSNELPIIITAQVEIPAGKELTLDLNGKTVNSVFNGNSTTNHIYALSNKGTLTIQDSKDNGSINSRGIYNYGSLTLNGGAINAIDGNGGYAVNNQSGSTFVMNGGVVAATIEDDHQNSSGGYDATALKVPADCTATLNGGTINNVCDFTFAIDAAGTLNIPETSTIIVNGTHGAIAVSGGVTTINAGTFQIPADNYSRSDNVLYVSGGSLVVNGGTFIGDSDTAAGGSCLYDAAGKAVVNGGTFKGSSGGDVWGTNGTTIKGGTFENLTETQHIAAGYELNADGTVAVKPVAEVNGVKYASFADAAADAQAGSEIKLLANIEGDITVPANVTLNGNGKQISGGILAEGDITFAGVTTAADFDAKVVNTAVNIPAGASLQLTGSARLVIGHGATFNITGTIADAKTADKATLVPSLKIAAGASITGNGVTFNVNNAYIVANANTTSKNSNANGTLDFNINNSIWEQTGVLAFYVPTSGKDPVVNFELKNSVLTTTSHLVFSVTKGEVVIDNSNVNVGTSRQIENRSTMTIKNGSVVNGAVATSSNAINPGTIIVENATYAVTGQFSGAAEGTGTLVIKKGANVSVGSIKADANVTVDAEGMTAGDEINFTANLSQFTGELSVINNDKLEAQIVNGKIVLAAKPVAKIDETKYETLEAAFAAATEGQTITLLDNATPALTSQRAITKAAVIDLGGKTLTLTEDDLYFGTTTFKNGTIIVDSSVKPSTAVFWMFANQTLTFDNVKIVATGVTGTYLIGLDGNNSDLNLLNGSEIFVENTTALDLDIICVNASTGNDINVENSKVNVTNLDGRVFFRGNYTVAGDSEINLAGITKAGFRIEAGQTLTIKDNAVVNIAGELRDGGIHMTDLSATYTKAETATVNATLSEVTPAAVIGAQKFATLQAAINAAKAGDVVTVFEGTYAVPAMKAGITIVGEGNVLLEGTLSGTLENLTMKNIHIKGGNAQRYGYAKGDLVFENVTFEATSVYALHFDGITADANLTYKNCTIIGWAALGGSPASCVFEGCTIKGNGTYGVIRTYFNATITGCTFDVANVNTSDNYEDGIHAVEGAKVVVNNCTNANGDMKDIVNVHGTSEVKVGDIVYKNVAKEGNNYYTTLAAAFTAVGDGAGKTVELIADVDLAGAEWTPVTFNGVFDGKGHTISNLVVNGAGNSDQGFFAKTQNGEIKNVTFHNANVTGRLNVGVVAGTPYTSKYTNVKVTGHVEVNGMAYVGGVGGKNAYANWTDITVDVDADSYVKATSTENGNAYRTYVGGVIGFNGEGSHTFQNISSNIKVIGDVMDIGGIFGILHYGNNAEDITFKGAVEAPANAKEVGGIAGVWHNQQGQTVTITNAVSEGTVKVGDVSTTGSIVGGAYNADNKYEANSGSLIINGNEAWLPRKVTTKADLDAALAAAKEGDIIVMDADIDYGTTQLAITKAITLDLGGNTLTTGNAYGGMSIKNNPTVKNGNIVHASNTAAIKVWNATAFEDLVIDVQGKGDANKTIGGIVLQSGSTTKVGSIKNVTIKGAALTNGIETYNCGDATENVIGAMENVTIDAQGTGLLISAPCGTATNCNIYGGVTGIELWIKGNYSATLALVDSDVKGGEKPVYVHDEFSTNPDIQNNGTLKLAADEATTFISESGALAAVNIARAENADRTVVDKLIENAIVCVGDVYFDDFAKAFAAVKDGQTVTLLAGTHSEGTVKLPATLKNVTIKGAASVARSTEETILKDMTISAADGNSYSYVGLTFDGITFDNSRILLTGWRNGEETIENLTVTNCTFKNLNDNTNSAPVHINKDAAEAVKNFTFTNNVIDGATGGSKSGIYAQVTGDVVVENNVINNVSFRPYVIQVTTDDGIADNFTVRGNTFSGSAVGRAQGLGNNAEGTDNVNLVVSNNIFKGITDSQQICYWNFNAATTTADLSKNYYDIDILANPGKIYYNSAAVSAVDLVAKKVFPIYTELNEDGTINLASEYSLKGGTWGGIDWTLTNDGTLTIAPTKGTPVADKNSGKTYEVGAWREAVRYNSKGDGEAIEGWPYDRSKVKTLIIEEGVISIGSFTAQGFTNLTGEVVIPSTVKYIGQEAFQRSTMTKLTFAEGGTEELCIAQGAFKNLIIEEVSLPADRPVHLHAWVFNNCHNLKTAHIPASVVSVHGTNHIDYFKNFNEHSNPTWTKSSEIFAYNENMETITFGSKEVRDMFYANNNGTSKDYVVATVGLASYCNIADAIEAVNENGDTIKMHKNATLTDTWTIPAGKKITLNLNGKTISQTKECTASYEMINNKGNLNIVGSGKISFKDTGAGDPTFGWGSYTVRNEGNLVVENATIEHLGTQTFGTHCIMAIYQYSGSTIINGGTISTPNYRSVRLWKGDMTINGGTFDGQVWVQAVDNTAKLTVNGGTFAPNGNDASAVFVTNNQYDVEFAVENGTFNGKIGCSDATKLAGAITGGKFTEKAKNGTNDALLATGLAFGTEVDGYYAIVDDPATHYIATLEDLKAFRDDVNNGTNYYAGVDVYLAADIDMAGENWVGIGSAAKDHGFMGNFDGQGYKIMNLTINNPTLDGEGYAYAGLFGVTEGTDKNNQNTIKNLIIKNVTINTTGQIVAAAIAYPYYTIVDNVKVCGNIAIEGDNYTAGVLAYTRRCVNASNLAVAGNDGSYITGAQVVGGVISDIQMNGGLVADYKNFSAEGVTVSGTKNVGGISGIIATQTLNGATVKNVTLNSGNAGVGIVAGCLGGTSTISNVVIENVTGATAVVGATYDDAKPVQAQVGDTYYATLAKAIEAAEAGATVELLADVTLAGGYEDATEGLRIEKEITLNGNNHTIDCGNFQKGIRVYNSSNAGDFNVNFNNVKVVNKVANGRCIDTRSGNINLKVNSSTLIATNGNSQPLTIGGNDPVHRVTLNGTTIDAGTSGYAVISFVSTNVDITGVNNSTISGYAAFYLKGDAKTTNLNLGQGVYTGTNNHAVESGLFGTVVLEGDNNVVNLLGTNATVKAVANNTAPQAAFLVLGDNNIIKVTKESAKIITEGNAYEAMVKAENAATTTFVDMGIERKLVAENGGYQFYSFEDAVRFAGNEGTIKIVNDFELAEAWTVPAGEAYTLDLNGKTVTYTSAVAGEDMITNRGNLTITDSSDAKTGKLAYANIDDTASNVTVSTISTEAGSTLVVNGGTIENKTVKADGSSIYSYAIDILTNGNLGDVNVTINGGTVYSDYMAIRQFNNGTACKNSLTINGGYIYGAKRAVQVHMDNNAAVTAINGGKIKAGKGGYAICNFAATSDLAVTGGEFIGTVYSARENFISGGIYDAEVYAGYCATGYMPNKNTNGTYGVVLAESVYASIDGVTYGSLKAAIDAAKAGDTITLLQNVTENVTISKNLTIDGAGKTITGMITTDGKSLKVTIKNVNFDGNNKTVNYAMRADDDLNLVVENCSVKDYLYGFLYANKSNDKIVVKNVTVENCAEYGAYLVAFNSASFENFTVEGNTKYGIAVANSGARTVNLKNVTFEGAEQPLHINELGTGKVTFKFSDINEMSKAEFYTSQYVKVVAAAQVGTKVCGSLNDAFAAAQTDETVKMLSNLNLGWNDVVKTKEGYDVLAIVEDKNIVLDMNGKKISVNHQSTTDRIYSVVFVEKGAGLTVTGYGSIDIDADDNAPKVAYMFWKRGDTGYIVIQNGNFHADNTEDSMVYTNGSNIVTVNGGTFILDANGTRVNGFPWIFNVVGNDAGYINVNGGTYNYDIRKQHYAYEAKLAEGLTMRHNDDGTWTVVDAIASVVGADANVKESYGSIQEAIDAAQNGETVKLLVNVELGESLNNTKEITLDLNSKTVTGVDTTTKNFGLINNNGTLTIVGDGVIKLTATVNSGWNRYSAVISNNPGATLTINSGTIEHLGGTDMAYGIDNLTNGNIGDVNCTINGGTIKSTYRAIRQFLNSDSKENNLTINGGVIEGTNKSIFFHDPSTKANNGTLTVAENAAIYGDVYLFVTEGSTEWPVNVSIADYALAEGVNVVSKNVPANYEVVLYNDVHSVEKKYLDELTIVDGQFTEFVNKNNKTIGKLTYKRSFSTAWTPLYVPFEIPVSELAADGLEVAYINGVRKSDYNEDGEFDNNGFNMELIMIHGGKGNADGTGKKLKANYPYFVRSKSGIANMDITLEDVTLYAAEEKTYDCTTFLEKYEITGNCRKMTSDEFESNNYIVGADGWGTILDGYPLNPFRFYMTVTSREDGSPIIGITFMSISVRGEELPDGTTIIYDVEAENNSEDMIFDLSGRRVLETEKGGIYIKNGEKFIAK